MSQEHTDIEPVERTRQRLNADVPYGVQVAAAWSWRLVIIVVAIALGIWLFSHVSLLVVPLLAAALIATLLYPIHEFLMRYKIPPILSVLTVIIGFLTVLLGLFWMAGQQLALGFADMYGRVQEGIRSILAWLETQGITVDQWSEIYSDVLSTVRDNSDVLVSGALGFGSTATNVVTGVIMAIFALIFFLLDGPRIWAFFLRFVPERHRRAIGGSGHAGWGALGSYVRVQIFVAFVDAVGIGVGAWLLGVPLALPLGVLVFLASFIPIVGAVLTGAIAVVLALVTNGFTNAILMLLVVLAVQQLESNVLQPIIMGKAVSLHPLVVFLAVAAGTALLGLVGAIFAVPVLAFLNAAVQYLVAKPWMKKPDPHATDPYLGKA